VGTSISWRFRGSCQCAANRVLRGLNDALRRSVDHTKYTEALGPSVLSGTSSRSASLPRWSEVGVDAATLHAAALDEQQRRRHAIAVLVMLTLWSWRTEGHPRHASPFTRCGLTRTRHGAPFTPRRPSRPRRGESTVRAAVAECCRPPSVAGHLARLSRRAPAAHVDGAPTNTRHGEAAEGTRSPHIQLPTSASPPSICKGIDNAEIIATVHARKAPMIPASTGPRI
jgi:hypothetical protein